MISRKLHKFGAIFAGIHLFGVLLTAWYVAHASSWAGVIWMVWAVIDIPLSLAYLPAMLGYFGWVDSLDNAHPVLAQLLYFPHLFHGLIGTIWWYFLPTLISKLRSNMKKGEAQKSGSETKYV
jgi:hypothetical protein